MAGSHPSGIDEFVPLIRALRDSGVAVFPIEHATRAVMRLPEQDYVLSCGRIIAEGATHFGRVVITYRTDAAVSTRGGA